MLNASVSSSCCSIFCFVIVLTAMNQSTAEYWHSISSDWPNVSVAPTSSTVIEFHLSHSVAKTVVLLVLLACIVVTATEGNLLIIVAVLNERQLKGVQNLMVLSLAVADLMVALLVMPFAAVDLLSRQWFLGDKLCELFIFLDVVCCTCSILHLVIIGLDRYRSVTRIDYSLNRSRKLINSLIATCWIGSVIISLPPIVPLPIAGWRDAATRPHVTGTCVINQNVVYTLFSTALAFYIPLFAIIIIYVKIYKAAKRRIKGRQMATYKQIATLTPGMVANLQAGRRQHATATSQHDLAAEAEALNRNELRTCALQTHAHASNGSAQRPTNGSRPCERSTMKRDTSVDRDRDQRRDSKQQQSVTSSIVTQHCDTDTCTCVADVKCANETQAQDALQTSDAEGSATVSVYFPAPKCQGVVSPATETTLDSIDEVDTHDVELHDVTAAQKMVTSSASQRQKQNERRERKAARTLAIITGTFIVCWLPFFVWSLARPFVWPFDLPAPVWSTFTWLGYLNSAVNPVLYTVFNPDFRDAFKRMIRRRRRQGVRVD